MMHSANADRSHALRNLVCCVCVGAGLLIADALAGSAAFAADTKGPQISRSIAKDIIAAQKALQANQFSEALKSLDSARATPGLTPYDLKTIAEEKAYAYGKLNNSKGVEESLEALLASGGASPEEVKKYTRALFGVSANAQQYPKAIEYGKKLVDSDAADSDVYTIITQSYYLQKDCKNTQIWADKTIAFERKSGEAPKENIYVFKLHCAFDSSDTPGTIAALEDLVRLTGKTEYWNQLLRFDLQDEKDDRSSLMIYRVMYNTNSMSSGGYYVDMAQLLADAPALPGEASAVLDKGVSSGTIGADQKERVGRLQAAFKTRADADRKGLPEFAAEAAKSPAGDLSVKLGEVYYGFGDYQNAATAINAGLQKGGVKHPEDAYVYLGLSQAALKNTADAKKAFAQLKTVPTLSPKVLRLWQLYSDRLGT